MPIDEGVRASVSYILVCIYSVPTKDSWILGWIFLCGVEKSRGMRQKQYAMQISWVSENNFGEDREKNLLIDYFSTYNYIDHLLKEKYIKKRPSSPIVPLIKQFPMLFQVPTDV